MIARELIATMALLLTAAIGIVHSVAGARRGRRGDHALPARVRRTLGKYLEGGSILEMGCDREDGIVIHGFTLRRRDGLFELAITADGELVELVRLDDDGR